MAEYKMLVVLKTVYHVYVEADDEQTAEELAFKKIQDGLDNDYGVWLLSDTTDITVDEVYE